jgi:hypothetical protein
MEENFFVQSGDGMFNLAAKLTMQSTRFFESYERRDYIFKQ